MKFKYYLRGAGFGIITATIILTIAFLFQDTMTDAEIMQRAAELGMVMGDSGNTPETLADVSKNGASQADLETGTDDGNGTVTDQPDQDPEQPDGNVLDDQNTGSDNSGQDTQKKTGSSDKESDNGSDKTGSSDKTDQDSNKTNQDSNKADQNSDKANKNKSDDKNSNNNKKETKSDDSKTKGDDPDSGKPGVQSGGNQSDNSSDSGNTKETSDGNVVITVEAGDVSRIVSGKVKEAGLVENQADFNAYLGANGYDNQLQPGTYEIKKGSTFRQIADILTSR